MQTILKTTMFVLVFLLPSCKTTKPLTVSSETQYISNPNDGVVTLTAVGQGKKEADAIADAFRTGFTTVLFRGLPGFSPLKNPMIANESTALSKHKSFFDGFFNDGNYVQFVTKQEPTTFSGDKKIKIAHQTFSVNYKLLRKHLEQNNVIRKFGL